MADILNHKYHTIRFSTKGEEHNEYCFSVLPLTEFHDAGLDHHIQLKIVEYMRQNGIKDRELEYRYYDDKDNLIISNAKPLEHGTYEVKEDNIEESKTEIDKVVSRRGFFKKAAGKVLPVIGTIFLSSIPSFISAIPSTSTPMNCNGSCSGSCSGDCSGSCDTGCTGGCGIGCSGYCDNSCGYHCNSSCKGSCNRTCTAQCRDGCTNCKGTCSQICKSYCHKMCDDECISGCKGSCSFKCGGSCGSDCQGKCDFSCGSACARECSVSCYGTCRTSCTNASNLHY